MVFSVKGSVILFIFHPHPALSLKGEGIFGKGASPLLDSPFIK
jgi:hypothetical protein